MDPNRLCPNCLREMPQAGQICPFCGYDSKRADHSSKSIPPYTVLFGRYLIGTVLGEGGFGITYRGWDLVKNRKVAIKEYFPAELVVRDTIGKDDHTLISVSGRSRDHFRHGLQKYENEARCLMQLNEVPGVVGILDYFRTNGTAYIVMEFVEGMTLRRYLSTVSGQCLSERETLNLFRPVIEALQAVHVSGMIHRDISPDNIIIQPDGTPKLIDFGAAREVVGAGVQNMTVILKHGYAPEEQYRAQGWQGPSTDVYALCATMYRTLTGQIPSSSMTRVIEEDLRPLETYPQRISQQTCQVLKKGMAIFAQDRYQTMRELMRELYRPQPTSDPVVNPVYSLPGSTSRPPQPVLRPEEETGRPKMAKEDSEWDAERIASLIILLLFLIGFVAAAIKLSQGG